MRVRSINNDPAVNRSDFMPEIPEIGVPAISVPEIPSWQSMPPQSIPKEPPITLLLGWPIADMPGCVETRNAQPGNLDAYDTDPKGNFVVCDGTMPSFPAMDFTPGTLTYGPAKPPSLDLDRKKPESAAPAKTPQSTTSGTAPDTSSLPKDPPCPPYGSQSLGSYNKLGNKVLAGYELQDGKCVKIWDPVPIGQIVSNYVPQAGPTVSIALTAAFATTAAIFAKPIASVLQKLAKPLTKKVVKKVNQKLGRKVKPESLQQRRVIQRHRNQAIRDLRRALGK
tara:strand:+ start:545 stop:1387 length:843 start_codon:yes stop_codon:yes gene_type:complete